MTKPQRIVFIDVVIHCVDPLDFDVFPSEKNDPELPTGPDGIIFENDGYDGFKIYFELKGETFGYFFPPHQRKHDAVWSQLGTVCPRSQVWDVFRPLQVVEPNPPPGHPVERRILIVRNKNPGPHPGQGQFQYNLRVTNGTDWKDLDPGGTNNNGSTRAFDWSYIAVGVGTGVVSSVLTLLAVARTDLICPGQPGF